MSGDIRWQQRKETARQIVEAVIHHYHPLFRQLEQRLLALKEKETPRTPG